MDEPLLVSEKTFWLIEPKVSRHLVLHDNVTMNQQVVGKKIELQFECADDPTMALDVKAYVETLTEALVTIEPREILPEKMSLQVAERLFKGPLAACLVEDLKELGHRVLIRKLRGKWEIVTAERFYTVHRELIKLLITERLDLSEPHACFVRTSPKWREQQEDLQRSRLILISMPDSRCLRLDGYATTVMESKKAIEEFLQQQDQITEKVLLSTSILRLFKNHFEKELEDAHDLCPNLRYKFKKPKPPSERYLEVKGNAADVEKFVGTVNGFVETLCKTNIKRNKPGMSSFYIGSESSGQLWLQGLQSNRPITVDTFITSAFIIHQNNIKPRYIYGNVALLLRNIASHQSDVLVNTVSSGSGDLSRCGEVAMALLQAGGEALCQDFRALGDGEVEVSHNTATLGCHLLIHAGVMKPWREDRSLKPLRRSFKACLTQTSQFKMKSVAFPLDGLKHAPPQDLANAIVKVALAHPAVQVQIIASSQEDLDELDRTLRATVKDLEMPTQQQPARSLPASVPGVTEERMDEQEEESADHLSNLTIELGDVTESQADVLVCSVASTNAQLSSCGEVATAFAGAGQGAGLEDAFRAAGGVPEGKLWTYKGAMGNLQCQQVFVIGISNWKKQNEETYSQLIDECLKQAGAAGFTSIHFPSFGCGALSWPPEEMAGMLQAAARVHPRIHVKVLCKNEETMGRMMGRLQGGEIKPKHNITVVHRNIVEIQADVLVNSVATDSTDLGSCGEVAGFFLKAGGDPLQAQYKELGGVRQGQVKCTPGPVGAIQCRNILHMRIGPWADGVEPQILSQVQQCFQHVTSLGHASIVFPTFGCGNLRYPPESVMKVVCTVAQQHPAIQVTIAVLEEKLVQIFEDILTANFSHDARELTERLNLCVGNICDKQVDVAVCSVTNDSPKLARCGEIALSFAKAGGNELSRQYEQLGGLAEGQIRSLPACGGLKCKQIVYVSVRKWDEATQEVLRVLFSECMRVADEHGLTTLGIPTLGCGGLNFPPSSVARLIHGSFAHTNRFKVAVVARQYKTYMEFQTHFQDLVGAPLDSPEEASGDSQRARVSTVDGTASAAPVAIFLVEGDLLQAQSDVVVIPVTKRGAVLEQSGLYCEHLHARHGKALRGKYKGNMKPGSIATIDTPSSSTMRAQKLVFAALHDTWQTQDTEKLLRRLVKKCVGEVSRHTLGSIAFPCLDSDDLSYPKQLVANVLKEASAEAPSVLMLVYVSARNDTYTTLSHIIPEMQNPSITFHITAKEHKSLQEAERAIATHLDEQFSSKALELEDTRLLPRADCLSLQALSSHTVHVSIDPQQDRITVAGELAGVDKAANKALKVLEKHKQRLQDPEFVKQHKGANAYLRLLSTQTIRTPKTWQKFPHLSSDDPRIDEKHKASDYLVDCDVVVQNQVRKFVQASWTGIQNITSVQRIENPGLYLKYAAMRQHYIERACKASFSPPAPDVITAAQPFVSARISEVNEYFFFHGSKTGFQKAIITKGFDFRKGGNGLFGKAVYMAEAVQKSHGYSDGTMFIARGLVGEAFVSPSQGNFVKPPCRSCSADVCEHSTDYDSIIGDTGFREFMFYDRYLCYPEFLVKYTQ